MANQLPLVTLPGLIRPDCRRHFTDADRSFILQTAGTPCDARNHTSLLYLLGDTETRDLVLDSRRLHDAIFVPVAPPAISAQLFFYVLVRRELRRAGLDDRVVADYVAELLSKYVPQKLMARDSAARIREQLVSLATSLPPTGPDQRLLTATHIGNHTLFLLGLFPDEMPATQTNGELTTLGYYEALGQARFGEASHMSLAAELGLNDVLAGLSTWFRQVCLALNRLAAHLPLPLPLPAGA